MKERDRGLIAPEAEMSLRDLKFLAMQRPENDPYRQVILAESDRIPARDFPGKAETWVILLRLAAKMRREGAL